ncbi:MAG: DUF6364 family protein [Propionibacteriaceae bacterium]|jgi:hypothetical protein|nr:DUF6364 family protein [Propionibacteriaceae bacterium]
MARNITLTLPEPIVRKARIMAAERDTSVSALVGELLEQAASAGGDYQAAWEAEKDAMRRGIGLTVGDITWSRDEVHDR